MSSWTPNLKIGHSVPRHTPGGTTNGNGKSSSDRHKKQNGHALPRDITDIVQPFPSASTDTPPDSPASHSNTNSSNLSAPRRYAPVPPARYNMPLYQGRVKSVQSGDSVTLVSSSSTAEKSLSLAYVTAPHLKRDGDEPWSYQARDALRMLLVGKDVQFQVLYNIPGSGREYGIIYLNDGRKLPDLMVEAGWLKLRDDAGKKEDSEEAIQHLDKLRMLQAAARNEEKGIWQKADGHIEVQHDTKLDQSFLDVWKGKTVDGLVERVLSGDRMLMRLLISPTKHVQVMTLVAGIRAPATERANGPSQAATPAEPYGDEAKKFVEDRLLQRSVKVDILGLSPQNQLIASVKHPKGSIAHFVLEAGLARCSDFHSTLLGADMAPLRQAEKTAQQAKAGQFKGLVVKAAAPGGNLDAQVTRIFSADTIYVKNRAGAEKRINFSSVRGPRPSDPAEGPFRDEAKEFLRKRIIGKHVRVSIDGSRPATGEYEAKDVATITFNDKNIGLVMVQEGWCSVIRHKRDDTDRAPNYDELLAAQEAAKEAKKGMWSGKPAKSKQYTDASETVQKAKMQVATLQRQKKIPAIVDFVKGGSRFTLLIPRENIKLTFVLGGIRAPKSARGPAGESEPFGQEAHDLATKRLSQRDVEIDVHSIDKVGGFIGELYINKESFAKLLVEEGFATVHQYSAEQSGNATELNGAEQRAKEARKGLWANWDPSQDAAEDESAPTADTAVPAIREVDYRDVVITNVDETGKLKIQEIGNGTARLETMMSEFNAFHLKSGNSATLKDAPKAGEYVAAKFSADGRWYRARVRANDRTAKESEIVYVDYGNTEKFPWSKLRPLTPEFSPQKLRPQALDAVLSLIQLPVSPEYLSEAINYIMEISMNRELVASVDYTSPEGTLYITLLDKGSKGLSDSINRAILAEGCATVPTKLKPWERSFANVLKDYKVAQTEAKNSKLGMWEYGDLTED